MIDKLAVTDHILNFKNKWNCTQNAFLPKREKIDAKYLIRCNKFVLLYSLPKKKMFNKTSVKTTNKKKKQNHEPSWQVGVEYKYEWYEVSTLIISSSQKPRVDYFS